MSERYTSKDNCVIREGRRYAEMYYLSGDMSKAVLNAQSLAAKLNAFDAMREALVGIMNSVNASDNLTPRLVIIAHAAKEALSLYEKAEVMK